MAKLLQAKKVLEDWVAKEGPRYGISLSESKGK
jgi:hypothetical protein